MIENYFWQIIGAIVLILITVIILIVLKKNKGKSVKRYYDNKKLRRLYFIDKKGNKNGLDKFYFRNKKLNKQQKWFNNQLEGDCKVYYLSGSLYIHCSYQNNLLEGDYKVYDKNSKIIKHDYYEQGVCVKVIVELKVDYDRYENEEDLIFLPVLDSDIKEEFERAKSNYQVIKKEEETKDSNKSKKGFLPGLTKIAKVVSGVQAYQNRESSLTLKKGCEEYYDAAQKVSEKAREKLSKSISEFGNYRLKALHNTTGRFLGILKDMDQRNSNKEYKILNKVGINTDSIKKMERLDMEATEALKSTATVGAIGAAAAMGTPAIVTTAVGALATASTGTAISSLSGIAATNATMAWLGGGSLAAGGGGIAAGTTVLATITATATAGVGLVAAGLIASTYYSKKLTESKEYQKSVECHVADMECLWEILEGIKKRTDELSYITNKLEVRLKSEIEFLEPLAVDFSKDQQYYNLVFQRVALLAKSMSELAHTPLLDESGTASIKSAQIIKETNKVLNTQIVNHG